MLALSFCTVWKFDITVIVIALKIIALKSFKKKIIRSDTFSNGVITRQIALPTCRYQVLMDGPHGSPVKYTTVGEQVYHQWSCADEDGTVPGLK